jgi:non-structural maintenance of chromosomes element 4
MSDVEMDENDGELYEHNPNLLCAHFHHPEPSDMVFDPDQDPEEKRAVRQNYRSLAKKIEGMCIICCPLQCNYLKNQGGPNDFTAEELLSQVQKADQLFNRGN